MSGHNKWQQIRHKKSLTDKKKGQIFSKLARLITLAAKKGTDPKANPTLAQIIDQARAANMPGDNIERAIKRVSDKDQAQLEELVIEALGPGGVALKIRAITDNRNRTMAEIKKMLGDHESKLVQPGSLSWMFNQKVSVDPSTQEKVSKLFEALDDQDEVEDVSSNLNEEQ
ncbi:MAG: YebC/PmpR family DNA-binding transcriptional regulator [Candidatus Yanofskybacteria bacterium]|nr:YebC/PmpR family DNA-binding transcriptional regulator [Candidatus Yanofskybacteria bacterium]